MENKDPYYRFTDDYVPDAPRWRGDYPVEFPKFPILKTILIILGVVGVIIVISILIGTVLK